MVRFLFFCLIFFGGFFHVLSQEILLEGYVFEDNNRGYLNLVKISLQADDPTVPTITLYSNQEGFFSANLPAEKSFKLLAEKDLFHPLEKTLSTQNMAEDLKIFERLEMSRKPGYLFDATLARKRGKKEEEVDAITGATIEVFNNTTEKEVLVLHNHPLPTFAVTLERGNHYTLLIRKDGFLAKRIEARVNVEGCILCIDGVKNVGPGVTDNLSSGFEVGTLLANIELVPADLNTVIRIENIYYDLDKWDIRPEAALELDKVITLMKDNPDILLELGSHTDSRGSKEYNQKLSSKRAQAAVTYIMQKGGFEKERMKAKGYGESALTNKCADGVACSEAEHQQNRRTELKIVGFEPTKLDRSLAEMILEEKFEQQILDWGDQEIIRVQSVDELPPDIKNQVLKASPADASPQGNAPSQPLPGADAEKKSNPEKNPGILESTKEENSKLATEENQSIPSSERAILSQPVERNLPAEFSGQQAPSPDMDDETQTATVEFTGYSVELFKVEEPLPPDHEIFKNYANIKMEPNGDGTFSYLLGEFQEEKVATWFLNYRIIESFPMARVVQWIKGKRY